MRLGTLSFLEGRYAHAAEQFDAYRADFPAGRDAQQANYWAGLSHRELGHDSIARQRFTEARRLDPFSYYGLRAADQLEHDIWNTPLTAPPPHAPEQAKEVERALDRVDLLREVEWEEAATYEMDRAKRHLAQSTGALYALAEALHERRLTQTAINIGREIQRSERTWNMRLLRLIYPFPYESIISAEARKRGVDPFLAAALIRQESMFNPRAVSSAGAIGLMQVMPRTGRVLATRLGIRRFRTDMLKRPEVNVPIGMAHLANALRDYEGRLPVVLAAYNAGSGRITRWREFPEFGNDDLFMERIPFAETRDYVKIVQQNARIYAALYGDD
jgi:soluble lytic murein transglycosylase